MGIWMPIWVLIVEFIVVAATGVFAVIETIYQRGWDAGAESVRDELVERERQDRASAHAAPEVTKTPDAKVAQEVKVPVPLTAFPYRTAPAAMFAPSATLHRTTTTSPPVPPPVLRQPTDAVSERTNRARPARRRIGGPAAPVPNPGAFPSGF